MQYKKQYQPSQIYDPATESWVSFNDASAEFREGQVCGDGPRAKRRVGVGAEDEHEVSHARVSNELEIGEIPRHVPDDTQILFHAKIFSWKG